MCECDAPVSVGSARGVRTWTRRAVPYWAANWSMIDSRPPASPAWKHRVNSAIASPGLANRAILAGAGTAVVLVSKLAALATIRRRASFRSRGSTSGMSP